LSGASLANRMRVRSPGSLYSNGNGARFWRRRRLRSSSSACRTWCSSMRTVSSCSGVWRSAAWHSKAPVA
jgi:hypothetical protein